MIPVHVKVWEPQVIQELLQISKKEKSPIENFQRAKL